MKHRRWIAAISRPIVTLLAAALPAAAQEPVTRVSVRSNGHEGNGDCGALAPSALSTDGRFVAFESVASNLVSNDTNGKSDVFVHDLQSGATVRVSVTSMRLQSNGASFWPSLSADGRFVAFQSSASNLIANDTNGVTDVFVHDRDPDGNGIFDERNGVTSIVSVSTGGTLGDDDSSTPSISDDGNLVAFASVATNLVGNDRNGARDIFLRDRSGSTTTRESVDSSGRAGNFNSAAPAISADGQFLAFMSLATNLVPGDSNLAPDVFLRDLANQLTTCMSVDPLGRPGHGGSIGVPAISATGLVVAFQSDADNLVANDTNGVTDVFVREVIPAVTLRMSVSSSDAEGDNTSFAPAISDDGELVAFHSDADNLVLGDGNVASDIFVRDIRHRTTVALSSDCVGALGGGSSYNAAISGDGALVSFTSVADDLVHGDTNGVADIFVHDANATGTDATWNNYGAGFPGTNGIPTLTAGADPVLGTTVPIDVGNSSSLWTIGFLLIGLDQASIPTHDGGTILVDWSIIAVLSIPPTGLSLLLDLPLDATLCGLPGYLQTLEMDSGAQYGLSFTRGLELLCGH